MGEHTSMLKPSVIVWGSEEIQKLSVSFDGAEELTGVSQYTFRKMVREGKLRVARIGRRIVIPMSELKRLLEPGAVSETSASDRN